MSLTSLDNTPDCFISNLHFLMKAHAVTVAALSRHTGIKPSTINNVLKGTVKVPSYLFIRVISEHFNLSMDQIVKQDLSTLAPRPYELCDIEIPAYNWHNIYTLMSNPDREEPHVITFYCPPDNNFRFALPGKSSLEPRFPANAWLIFNRDKAPRDNYFVLYFDEPKYEFFLMRLFANGATEYLTPVFGGEEKHVTFNRRNIIGVLEFCKFNDG